MNELFNTSGITLLQSGLSLLLQTSLLLGGGLWVLHVLRKQGSGARTLLGRALLFSVMMVAFLSLGLSLGGQARLPSMWNVSLPEPSISPNISPVVVPLAESPLKAAQSKEVHNESAAPAVANTEVTGLKHRDNTADASNGRPEIPARTAINPFSLIVDLWVGGALVLLAWLVFCHIALWRVRRSAQTVREPKTLAILSQVCAASKVPSPLLLCHPRVRSPFLTGLLRPAIVLPTQSGVLSDEALRAVLHHEVTHLKRLDLWWNALGRVICALLWPQPLIWILCRRLEQINEEACDEAVIQAGCQRQFYARFLLDFAEGVTPKSAERVAGAGVLTGRSSLARRVHSILEAQSPSPQVSARVRWVMSGGTLAAILAMPLLVSSNPIKEAGNAASNSKKVLQHFKDTNDYRVSIGGVSEGVLQGVSIWQKQNKIVTQVLLARSAKRESPNSKLWALEDVFTYTFNDDSGLQSESRSEKVTLSHTVITDYLEQQSQARDEPMPASVWKKWPREFGPPIDKINEVQTWADTQSSFTLTGRVVDDEGQPVAGAKVYVTMSYETLRQVLKAPKNEDYSRIFGYSFALSKKSRDMLGQNAVTNQDGVYRVTGLAAVPYELGMPGYGRDSRVQTKPELPAQILAAPQRITLGAQKTTSSPNLTLTRGGLLRVRVQDEATGASLSAVSVIGYMKGAFSLRLPSYWVDTDSSGESLFRFPEGKASLALGGNPSPDRHAFVTLSNGIYYKAGNSAKVSLDGGAPKPFSGRNEIQIIKGQTREVLLSLQRYVAPIPTPTPQLLPPPPGKATVIGRVVDEAGKPVGGVLVVAEMQQKARWVLMRNAGLAYSNSDTPNQSQRWDSINPMIYQRAITRPDGSYRLQGLTTAPYNIFISSQEKSDFATRTPSDRVASAVEGAWAKEGQVIKRTQPIILTRGALIQGRVVDKATGLGLGGVTFGSNGPQLPTSIDNVVGFKSDAQGRFSLRVAPGTTSIYIAGPSINDGNFVFADNGKSANVYRIQTNRGAYAGSENVQYELDAGTPQFGLNFSRRGSQRIEIQTQKGQTRSLTIHLRKLTLVKGPDY